MGNVLIDKWALSTCAVRLNYYRECRAEEDFAAYLQNEHQISTYPHLDTRARENADLCWQNFLTSLILWDNIYITHRPRMMIALSEISDIQELIATVNKNSKGDQSIKRVENVDLLERTINPEKYVALYEDLTEMYPRGLNRDLLLGGYYYLLRANALGYNYLPHPRRADIIRKSGFFDKQFDRTRYLEIIDAEVLNYMEELRKLARCQLKTISFPLLYYFISENSGGVEDELRVTMELRNNKNVKLFRKSINKIEEAYSSGNLLSLDASLQETRDICEAITREIYRKPHTFNVSLGISPSINIDGEISGKVHSRLHTTFLFDIASFAIKGKTKNKYNF